MITELKERLHQELGALTAQTSTHLGEDQGIEDPRATLATQQHMQRRIQFLHHTLSALESVDPRVIFADGAGFGSTVRLRDLHTGSEFTYTLMTGEAIDLEAGEISLASPVGHALLGRKGGDEIEVTTPLGRRHFRIVSMTTLQDDIMSKCTVPDVRCA
jgi:transcription elongation factor GreA